MGLSALGTDLTDLVAILRQRAQESPKKVGYTFLLDGETEEAHLTYSDLDHKARTLAVELERQGARGERVLLLYPPGLDYVVAYFACLYAGAAAVPAYPPDPDKLQKTAPRLIAILDDCKPRAVLTTSSIVSRTRPFRFLMAALRKPCWIASDSIADRSDQWSPKAIQPEAVAFLQYTSGSTAAPKGVMVTHRNLMDNLARIHRHFEHTSESRGVIWLPPYHDMGLIGGLLAPLYGNFPVTLMSPVAFLRKPVRWLQAVTRCRATTSGGPNFAYDLCVRRIPENQRQGLDLSSWQVAFNGAETIRPDTLDRFQQAFGPYGFRRTAFYPCYGLAEATLIATGGRKEDPPVLASFHADKLADHEVEEIPGGRILVGCGRAVEGHRVLIADPETLRPLPQGRVGEVLVAGPSVAAGYWNNLAATRETFEARAAGAGPYLRTGDLGFLRDGELFVCGRRKELMIIRGQNHYPQDIERTAQEAHGAIRTGCLAAFSITVKGEERPVLVAELRDEAGINGVEVVAAIRRAVASAHSLRLHAVGLVPRDEVPKTSSGKIQRRLCGAHYAKNKLRHVYRWDETG